MNDLNKLAIADILLSRLSESEVNELMNSLPTATPVSENALDVIFDFVIEKYGYSKNQVTDKSRKSELVKIRQIYAFLVVSIFDKDWFLGHNDHRARQVNHLFDEIAKRINRDRTNVNNLMFKVKNYMETDREYREELLYLEREILTKYIFQKNQ